jgi:predicted O-methyltransferase YrrM
MDEGTISDPYASHLHVLRRLGKGARWVLELGGGLYSTPLFLDRHVFPDLERLVTVEPDATWVAKLPKDDRLCVWPTAIPVYAFMERKYDLVFVDSAPEATRIKDIGWLTFVSDQRVVIHDFEHEPYRQAAKFDHIEIDKTLTPWTAVCWND